MSLLLSGRPSAASNEIGASREVLDLSTSTFASVHEADSRAVQRGGLRSAILSERYRQIVEIRLRHIPEPLPFPEEAIVRRLKDNDLTPPFREAHERVLELEVELALLQKSLSSPSSPKANGRAKQRRLGFIWDFLVKQAKQANEIRLQRIGRLNFNTEMFVRSDLPASYIVDVGYTTHWEIASLIIARNTEVERLVRRVTTSSPSEIERDGFLASKASLRDIEAAFREYLRNVGGISSLSDVILEWRDALEYYVDLFSASDLNAFRVLRPISVETLNVDAIDSISQGLRVATQNLRGQLVSKYPEGLLELSFLPSDDPYVMDLVRLELAEL